MAKRGMELVLFMAAAQQVSQMAGGTQGHLERSKHLQASNGCVSDLPMLSFALRPGPGLEDTIGKCTAGHPAGFWRKSLKRPC